MLAGAVRRRRSASGCGVGAHGAGFGTAESEPLPQAAWGRAAPPESQPCLGPVCAVLGLCSGCAPALLGSSSLPRSSFSRVGSVGSARASEASWVLGTRRELLQQL